MLSALTIRAKSVIGIFSVAVILSGYVISESVVPQWGYGKLNGPPTWANTFVTCNGLQQSPVALWAKEAVPIPPPSLTWRNYAGAYGMTLYNTGYTVKLLSSWKKDLERSENTRSYLQNGSERTQKKFQNLNNPSNDSLRRNLELQNELFPKMSRTTMSLVDRLWKVPNQMVVSTPTANGGKTSIDYSITTKEKTFPDTTLTVEQGITPNSARRHKGKPKQKISKEYGKGRKDSNKSQAIYNSNDNDASQIDSGHTKPNLRLEHGFAKCLRKHNKIRKMKHYHSTPGFKEKQLYNGFTNKPSTTAHQEDNRYISSEDFKRVSEHKTSEDPLLLYLINRYLNTVKVTEKANSHTFLSTTNELAPFGSVDFPGSTLRKPDTIGLSEYTRYSNKPDDSTTTDLIASPTITNIGGTIFLEDTAAESITSPQLSTKVMDRLPQVNIENFDPLSLLEMNGIHPTTNPMPATTPAYETPTDDLLGENNVLTKYFWTEGQVPWTMNNWSSIASGFLFTATPPVSESIIHLTYNRNLDYTSRNPLLYDQSIGTTIFKYPFPVMDDLTTIMDYEKMIPEENKENTINLDFEYKDGVSTDEKDVQSNLWMNKESKESCGQTTIPFAEKFSRGGLQSDVPHWTSEYSQNKIQEGDRVIFPNLVSGDNISLSRQTLEPGDLTISTLNEEGCTDLSEEITFTLIPWITRGTFNQFNHSQNMFSPIPIVVKILPNTIKELSIANRYYNTPPTPSTIINSYVSNVLNDLFSTDKYFYPPSFSPDQLSIDSTFQNTPPNSITELLNVNALIYSPPMSPSTESSVKNSTEYCILPKFITKLLNVNALINSPPTFSSNGSSINEIGCKLNSLPTPPASHPANTGSPLFSPGIQRGDLPRNRPFTITNTSFSNKNHEIVNTDPLIINMSNPSVNLENGLSFDPNDLTSSGQSFDSMTRQQNLACSEQLKDDSFSPDNGASSRGHVNYPNEIIFTPAISWTAHPMNTSFREFYLGLVSLPVVRDLSEPAQENTTKTYSQQNGVHDEHMEPSIGTESRIKYTGANTMVPPASIQQINETMTAAIRSNNIPCNSTERTVSGLPTYTEAHTTGNSNGGARTVNIVPRNEILKQYQHENYHTQGNEMLQNNRNGNANVSGSTTGIVRVASNLCDHKHNICALTSMNTWIQPLNNVSKYCSASTSVSPAQSNTSFNQTKANDSVLSKNRVTPHRAEKRSDILFPNKVNETNWTLGTTNDFAPEFHGKAPTNDSKLKNVEIDIVKKQNEKLGIILRLNKLIKEEKGRNKHYFRNRYSADSYSLIPTTAVVSQYVASCTDNIPNKDGMFSIPRVSRRILRTTSIPKTLTSKAARLFPSLRRKETSARMKRFDDSWTSVPQLFVGDDVFVLDSIYFHWGSNDSLGSEHQLNGLRFPLEMNAVHQRRRSALTGVEPDPGRDPQLVVAQFYEVCDNCHNKGLEILVRQLKDVRSAGASRDVVVPLDELVVPFHRNFFLYHGSLTTPPCTECVTYVVNRNVAKAAPRQIAQFRELLKRDKSPLVNNFRPLQPRNGRKILVAN